MTVSTFFPDADVENTSVDGLTGSDGVNNSWTLTRDDSGANSGPSSATDRTSIKTTATTNNWNHIYRSIFLFDTSSLGDADTIDSVTLDRVFTLRDEGIASQSMTLTTSTPASNTDIVNADFTQFGTTKQATDVTLASLTVDSSTYNSMTLNSTGLGNISKTGITKFGTRITSDNDNAEPTWASDVGAQVNGATADEVLSEDKRPKLVVTHTTPITFKPKAIVF